MSPSPQGRGGEAAAKGLRPLGLAPAHANWLPLETTCADAQAFCSDSISPRLWEQSPFPGGLLRAYTRPQLREPMKTKSAKASKPSPVRTLRAEIAAQTRILQRIPTPLGRPQTADATQVILRNVGKIVPPPLRSPEERRSLAARFVAAAHKNAWDPLTEDDWEDVWQILWEGEEPILAISRFQMRYRRRLEASTTSRPFKRLIHAYLHEFENGGEAAEWAGKLLRKIILQQKFPDLEFWREQDFKHEIFSIELGPKRLTQALLQAEPGTKPLAFLADCGLTGPLATRGLSRAAYRWALGKMGRMQTPPPVQPPEPEPAADQTPPPGQLPVLNIPLPVLTAFADWSLSGPDDSLLYPELWLEIYDALLAPWHVEDRAGAPLPIRRLLDGCLSGRDHPELRASGDG